VSREQHLRNKNGEYLKDKINELAINSKKIKNLYRTIKEFKRGYHFYFFYQLRNNLLDDGDLLADFHNILNR
jgi:hypothetical protein